jgi:signal transduction histidine kinase
VNLFLFDNTDTLVCSASAQQEDERLSNASIGWIQSELKNTTLSPGRPILRPIGTRWVSVISAPVVAGGVQRGTLVLLQLPDLFGREALPPGTVMTILDRNGVVLFRSDDPTVWPGKNARASGVARVALRDKEGIAEAIGIDGVSRQYGFTTLPELGWTIYVGIPTDVVMGPVRMTLRRGIAAGIFIFLLLLLIAVMLARSIERPIASLVTATNRAAHGTFDAVTTIEGPREIATLALSFNRMLDSRKALSDRLMVVQEEERSRIARELHDDLGQSLTALKMDVGGLLQKIPEGDGVSKISDRILRTIDSTVTAVQRISSELRPSILDDLGIAAAIDTEARLFEQRTGIECEVSLPPDLQLDRVTATTIYRIIQEALTNVARHSNATRVELRLRERADEILLEIRDDGRGVTVQQAGDPNSLGIIGIRERAALVGGTVLIEGVPQRGTIVSVKMPRL